MTSGVLRCFMGWERKRGRRSAVSQGIKREQVVAAMTHRVGTQGTQDTHPNIAAERTPDPQLRIG